MQALLDLTGLPPSETPLEIFQRFAPEAPRILDGDGSAELEAKGVQPDSAAEEVDKYPEKAEVLLRGAELRVSYAQGLAAGLAELRARRLFLLRQLGPLVHAARGMADDVELRVRGDWGSDLGEQIEEL